MSQNKQRPKSKKPNFFNMLFFILIITFVGFGGGNALMPVIKKYAVDKNKWITTDEFDKNVIITNMLPGPSVIEALSYIAIKHLGFIKGWIVVLLAALPHCLVAFLLFYFARYLPINYLYVIEVGVLVAIVGSLLGFGYQYLKKSKDKIKFSLWFILFLISFAFSLFVPAPYNIPIAIMLLVILIFVAVQISIRRKTKKIALEKQNRDKKLEKKLEQTQIIESQSFEELTHNDNNAGDSHA